MNPSLHHEIINIIEQSEAFCLLEGIELVFTYEISDDLLETISQRSNDLPSLYFARKEMLQQRLQNGCFLLKKGDEVVGHIFAHKHDVFGYSVYERSTLWVHPDYRKNNLGLLLMHRLTERLNNDFLISIAQTSKVHHYNEILGMKCVTLAEMSPNLVEELEKIGKLRDEKHYKYYVNQHLAPRIRRFK